MIKSQELEAAKQASIDLKSNLDRFLALPLELSDLSPFPGPEILDFVTKERSAVYKPKIKEGVEELSFGKRRIPNKY